MKKYFLLLVTLIFLVSCNLPLTPGGAQPTNTPEVIIFPSPTPQVIVVTATPQPSEPTAEPTVEGTPVTLGGVSMLIPACMPVSASIEFAPAQVYDPLDGPQDIFPAHRRINFNGYPLAGTFFPPFMRVFPLADFPAVSSPEGAVYVANTVADLQNLLATRPADVDGALPFLTMAGAAQIFHTKLAYLDFANGSGIRYLTSYGQYYVPYNNHDLFYTFQGLTSDGNYWVSVIFPVNHAILPPTYDSTVVPPGGIPIPTWDSPTYDTDMANYYAAMKAIMESTADDTFVPGLDCLDHYIESLNIGD
ncbi:MAG: hypothetical protein AAGU17_06485 [Anaerolineaceae bacterium]|jgi:hypothetical protein